MIVLIDGTHICEDCYESPKYEVDRAQVRYTESLGRGRCEWCGKAEVGVELLSEPDVILVRTWPEPERTLKVRRYVPDTNALQES